jgi:carboxymethylenebutenolidase
MTEDIRRTAIALHDRFTHGTMGRRAFMTELTRIAGGSAAAGLLMTSISARAQAQPRVAADDPRLWSSMIDYRFGDHAIRAYTTGLEETRRRTARGEQPPFVVVIHENRGLNEHIRDVARRVALAGYRVLAPDFLSIDGGATPADEDQARTAIGALDMPRVVATGAALIDFLHSPQHGIRPFDRRPNRVGIVGFCWGGAMVNRLAVVSDGDLGAAASFYGPAPDPSEAPQVHSPLLIHLAGRDDRVNATARPWAAALQAAGKDVTVMDYPDVDHAFHNDTSEARYNRAAAERAWAATMDFFRRHLSD